MTVSTVDTCQFLLIGGLWAVASGADAEPKAFLTGLSVSSRLEEKDKDPWVVNTVDLLTFRKLEWKEMSLKFKVEGWAPPHVHNRCVHRCQRHDDMS